jgi:hypothetical protein
MLALLLVAVIALRAAPARAQDSTATRAAATTVDSAKARVIREFLDASGSRRTSAAAIDQMIDMYRRRLPNVPSAFWEEMQKSFDLDELERLLVPIYDRHFSIEELQSITAFLRTPSGQKFVSEQPAIVRESMLAGQEWGRAVGERIQRRLREQGYVKS